MGYGYRLSHFFGCIYHFSVDIFVEINMWHGTLSRLQSVDGHVGDAVVVDECPGYHEAVEYLVAVELK